MLSGFHPPNFMLHPLTLGIAACPALKLWLAVCCPELTSQCNRDGKDLASPTTPESYRFAIRFKTLRKTIRMTMHQTAARITSATSPKPTNPASIVTIP